jgi:hypothetical protein
MILSAVRVARILKSSGLDPRKIASDPKLFDDACKAVQRAAELTRRPFAAWSGQRVTIFRAAQQGKSPSSADAPSGRP